MINGCTDLFVSVFGDAGRPARSAVGMGSLPRNIAVEVEAIALLRGLRAKAGLPGRRAAYGRPAGTAFRRPSLPDAAVSL